MSFTGAITWRHRVLRPTPSLAPNLSLPSRSSSPHPFLTNMFSTRATGLRHAFRQAALSSKSGTYPLLCRAPSPHRGVFSSEPDRPDDHCETVRGFAQEYNTTGFEDLHTICLSGLFRHSPCPQVPRTRSSTNSDSSDPVARTSLSTNPSLHGSARSLTVLLVLG